MIAGKGHTPPEEQMSKSCKGVCQSQSAWQNSSKCDAKFQEQSVCVPFHSCGTPKQCVLDYVNDVPDKGRYMKHHARSDGSCQCDRHPDARYKKNQIHISAPKGELSCTITNTTRNR